jgi:Caspase domain
MIRIVFMKYLLSVTFLFLIVFANGQNRVYNNKKYNFSIEFPTDWMGLAGKKLSGATTRNYNIGGILTNFFIIHYETETIDSYKKDWEENKISILYEKEIQKTGFKIYQIIATANIKNTPSFQYTWLIETTNGLIMLSVIGEKTHELIDYSYVCPFIYSFEFNNGTKIPNLDDIPIDNRNYGGPMIGNGVDFFENQNEKKLVSAKTEINQNKKTNTYVNNLEDESNIELSDIDVDIPIKITKNSNTFAVIIGNENYDSEITVSYAINDAQTFHKYITKTLGIPEEHVHIVTNATYGKILKEIQWVSNIAKAYNGECKIIFYYAGHGMPDESTKDAYILPVDGDASQTITAISLESLYTKLNEYPSEQVTVFLDACFSGAARDGMLASGRGVKIKPKTNKPEGNLVVFSAVSGDQTAHPYESKYHGLFSYYLMKKLQETKGEISYGELSEYIIEEVNRKSAISGEVQTPQVNTSINLQDTWKSLNFK